MAFSQPLAGQFHHQIKKELTPLIQLVAPKLSDSKQAHINNPIAELYFLFVQFVYYISKSG